MKGVEGGVNKVWVHRWTKVGDYTGVGAQDVAVVVVGVADGLPVTWIWSCYDG